MVACWKASGTSGFGYKDAALTPNGLFVVKLKASNGTGKLAVKGKGAAERRTALLRELFQRAKADEQDFLVRLIVGELRQGALEGVMTDAVAAAAEKPAAEVRRAVAFAGAIAPVAQAA